MVDARKSVDTSDLIEEVEGGETPPSMPDAVNAKDAGFAPGNLIAGKYRVERVIGEGGLGIVVAARHVELEQTVAIKYLQTRAVKNKKVVERFLREARMAGKIRSEHVARVYDVGVLPEGPYIVMEYLEGIDLRTMLEAGPLPMLLAVDYILQACEALAEAHAAGIVHRDVKPDNLFLAKKAAKAAVIKILDFGISKLAETRGSSSGRRLTAETDKFGTPSYMSPEQLRSAADVDARADIWAIGVVLYELLSGMLPFNGDGLPELVTAILTLPPAPLTPALSSVPEELEGVIAKCLEKDRASRFRNVAELAQELRPFAPLSAHARIDHIVGVVREAGSSVRPPSMTSDSLRFSLPGAWPQEPGSNGAVISKANQTTGSLSWWSQEPRRRQGLVALACFTVVAAIVTLSLVGVRGARAPSAVGMSVSATNLLAPSADPGMASASTPPVAPPSPQPSQAAAPALPSAVTQTPPPVAAPTAGAKRHNPRSTSSSSPATKPPGPAPTNADPNDVLNPFQ